MNVCVATQRVAGQRVAVQRVTVQRVVVQRVAGQRVAGLYVYVYEYVYTYSYVYTYDCVYTYNYVIVIHIHAYMNIHTYKYTGLAPPVRIPRQDPAQEEQQLDHQPGRGKGEVRGVRGLEGVHRRWSRLGGG